MVSTLFPEIHQYANLISGSNKSRVKSLHEILDRASKSGDLPFKFYSITDRDSDQEQSEITSTFTWSVYHIENFLLIDKYIYQVLSDLDLNLKIKESQIEHHLLQCAKETIPALIRHDLSEFANHLLINSIDLGTNPKKPDLVDGLNDAIHRSLNRITASRDEKLTIEKLTEIELGFRTKYEQSLNDDTWRSLLRGRDIIKRFSSKYAPSVHYIAFRNLLLSAMAKDNYRPQDMQSVIGKILL